MSGTTRHSGARKRSVGRPVLPVLPIMILMMVLTGCGRGVPVTTQAVTATTLVTSSTATAESGDELPAAETRLPDGHIKAMGFIRRVWMDGGTRRLEIDYAEMLTGAEADTAAVDAGLISAGEHVDNDYFIRNVDAVLRTFTVSPKATFFEDTGVAGVPVTWETFLGYWSGDPAGAAQHADAPWWIERDGTAVVKVNQQYLP